MSAPDPFDFDRPGDPPYQLQPIKPTAEHAAPRPFRGKVLIQTLHDGAAIPARYRFAPDGNPRVDPELLRQRFSEERDWGANLVAEQIASALGLRGYGRCRVARALVDFNRFPGSTPDNHLELMDRQAINFPFSSALVHEEKLEVLERYYDGTSALLEQHMANKTIILSVHTYDERHPSHTRRADVSLVHLPRNYQREARMPYGVFDPLYPDQLAESTCSRILRDRISLNLERSGIRVIHNHPYAATEGSIEVRSQIWFFFRFLRRRFENAFGNTADKGAYQWVWKMLLNTNLRHQDGEALRGYLHRYREVPRTSVKRYRDARRAYEHVKSFLDESSVVSDFRHSRSRPSSLGLEVRKDLVCELDPVTRAPARIKPEQVEAARLIGKVVASAISIYFDTDRPVYLEDDKGTPR